MRVPLRARNGPQHRYWTGLNGVQVLALQCKEMDRETDLGGTTTDRVPVVVEVIYDLD